MHRIKIEEPPSNSGSKSGFPRQELELNSSPLKSKGGLALVTYIQKTDYRKGGGNMTVEESGRQYCKQVIQANMGSG